jgi:hypothetical protein
MTHCFSKLHSTEAALPCRVGLGVRVRVRVKVRVMVMVWVRVRASDIVSLTRIREDIAFPILASRCRICFGEGVIARTIVPLAVNSNVGHTACLVVTTRCGFRKPVPGPVCVQHPYVSLG